MLPRVFIGLRRRQLATHNKGSPVALLQLLFVVVLALGSKATPLSIVRSVNDLWSALAIGAAKDTIKAIRKTAEIELELQKVPMETFQVLVGRQHHLGVEVEGVTYELLLGNEAEALEQARERAAAAAAASAATSAGTDTGAAAAAQALPAAGPLSTSTGVTMGGDGAIAPVQLFSGPRSSRTLELPETALAGPLELVLREPEPLRIYSPLAADLGGSVRRIVVEAGVAVRVAGLRRVVLRRSLELPRLPGQYLAEVYAQGLLGEPEEGFESSPGIMYMAAQLRKAALAAFNSSRAGDKRGPAAPLLSLDVETVSPGSLTITSTPELPAVYAGGPAPRLKVRRSAGGTVELSLRQGQVTPAQDFNPAALARVWAWPLPHTDSSSWLPYETVLRSVLAAHPFNMDSVIQRGIGMRLTKSTIQGVHLISFDMEVRARQPRPEELEGSPIEWNEKPLELWEAVVQVQPKASESSSAAGRNGAGGYTFVPLHVKRKQSYQNTMTMSRSAMLLALTGGRNASLSSNGYDSLDLGIAANAP